MIQTFPLRSFLIFLLITFSSVSLKKYKGRNAERPAKRCYVWGKIASVHNGKKKPA
ncbi:MAG: hypothetical protein ABI760_10740 [Ferruginibacter sp.]